MNLKKLILLNLPYLLFVYPFRVMAEQQNKCVECEFEVPACTAALDTEVISRVLENIFVNTLRYAKENVRLFATLSDDFLSISVIDDGQGFSEQMLSKKVTLFYSEDSTAEHMGLGLATSRILCQKHGGSIALSNIEYLMKEGFEWPDK